MDPTRLIPTPDTIPAAWGWFDLLLIATFFLHLLVMNFMLGGGLISLFNMFRPRDENQLLNKEISVKWPFTIAFAVNLGVAPLLFIQVVYGHFIYSSSILMAVWWLSIIALLILAYYGAYIYDFKFDQLKGVKAPLLFLVVVLMLYIAFFFTNNMTLMLQPDRWQAYFQNTGGTFLNLGDPALIPRYLHMVTGSVAVAGLGLAALGHFNLIRTSLDRDWMTRTGLGYFRAATMVQVLIGVWFLLSLPADIMALFLGKSVAGTVLLAIGAVLAVAGLLLARKGKTITVIGTGSVLLLVMVLIRDQVRLAYLRPYFKLSDLTVHKDNTSFIFFLVVLVIGIALMGYVLKLLAGCERKVSR